MINSIQQLKVRLAQSIQELLYCPICHAKLKQVEEQFECINSECVTYFPIVDGIPVLINEQSSVFPLMTIFHIEKIFLKKH